MSLINKMLQDLDARGSGGADPLQAAIRPVAKSDRQVPLPVVVASLAGALALALGGAAGWRYLQRPKAPVARPLPALVRPAPAVVAKLAPVTLPAPATPPTAQAAPAAAPATPMAQAVPAATTAAPMGQAAPAALTAVSSPAVPSGARVAPAVPPAAAVAPVPAELDTAPDAAPEPARVHAKHKRHAADEVTNASKKSAKQAAKLAAKKKAAAVKAARPARVKAGPAASATDRAQTPQQRAESEYRRALASMGEGRVTDAIAGLEQTLRLDPRHEGARQTLVGLLIENKRPEDAMRQLQVALALDARQPSLAMLLARMQIERGGSGIDTLQRTLPAAAGKADYHAFLAGALARAQRHREAAEQYQAALRTAPRNGVWLMGLGMSLQAQERNAEASEAFQRAKASGSLSPDLTAFVERKLQQLAR